mgnify:FL=1
MKIWNNIPIKDNGDKLIDIPSYLNFLDPHPYSHLGAPYKDKTSIWKLREEVVNRLVKVNDYLISKSSFNLLIYDSWRPLEVQEFMFKRAFLLECEKSNIDTPFENRKYHPSILKKVEKFWAYPSYDSRCPPPHSTGGALDVCLSDKEGNIVEMGSTIDQMDETSNPDFYAKVKNKEAIIWNSRRNLLREIMTKFGFAQHPNEWWHFSYGDQLWAWKNKKENAIYGKI